MTKRTRHGSQDPSVPFHGRSTLDPTDVPPPQGTQPGISYPFYQYASSPLVLCSVSPPESSVTPGPKGETPQWWCRTVSSGPTITMDF